MGGWFGAVLADLILQSLGWAGYLALILVGATGAVFLIRGYVPYRVSVLFARIFCGVIAVLSFACVLALLPLPKTWPYASGLGGFLGDKIFLALHFGLEAIKVPGSSLIVAPIALFLTIASMFFAVVSLFQM